MKRTIRCGMTRQAFLDLLKDSVDDKSIYSTPESDKPFFGHVSQDGFELMTSNTYGAKPVIVGTIQEEKHALIIRLRTRLTIFTKIVFVFFFVFGIVMGGLGYFSGGGILSILGVVLWLGFLLLIIIVSVTQGLTAATQHLERMTRNNGR